MLPTNWTILAANSYLIVVVLTTVGLLLGTRREALHFVREADLPNVEPVPSFRHILMGALRPMRLPVGAALLLTPAAALPAGEANALVVALTVEQAIISVAGGLSGGLLLGFIRNDLALEGGTAQKVIALMVDGIIVMGTLMVVVWLPVTFRLANAMTMEEIGITTLLGPLVYPFFVLVLMFNTLRQQIEKEGQV